MPEAAQRGRLPRVAVLTSVHPWNDPRIFLKESQSLAAAGYDVTLIAQCESAGTLGGVTIAPIPKPRSRLERMLATPWRVYRMAREFDICHFHDPELIPIGFLLKAGGSRVVYDVHEDLPRAVEYKHWIPAPLRRLVARASEALEWVASRVFDRVVAATPIIAARFPKTSTVTVQNFPILDELVTADPQPYAGRARHFIYVGNVVAVRSAMQMVDAIGDANLPPDTRLVLVGPCSPAALLDEMKVRPGWARTDYRGYQGRGEIAKLLGGVRAGLALLQPTQNLIDAFPTKMFEYMSAGLPVIASDFPICRDILGNRDLGLLADPRDPGAIATAMRWILDHPQEAEAMGQRGRAAVLGRYNWGSEARKLIAAYAAMAPSTKNNG